jgi:alanine dehydrogenase
MKRRSVIVDIAIDQGGSVETSRPTSLSDPTFVEDGVIHYCVPNIPAKVPRTATRAFQNQVLPFAEMIHGLGVKEALQKHPYLVSGLNLYEGVVTRDTIAETFKTEWKEPSEVLK